MVVITGCYAKLTKSVTETMARGTKVLFAASVSLGVD